MTLDDLEHFKTLLTQREQNLVEWLNSGEPTDDSAGRKVQQLLIEIKEALARVEDRTFGQCTDCDGEVEMHRLEVQPTAQICLACISDAEKTALEEELYLASRVHRSLLPQSVENIDGYEVAVKSLAAHHVGGDYYDFLPSANGGWRRVVIGDAMGKGMPAGLVMSNLQGALRILAEDVSSPALLMSRANRWLCRNVPVTNFLSLTVIAVEPGHSGGSQITYANAGHCPTLLMRKDGSVERLEATGTVLGVHADITYEEQSLELNSGDTLVLYTDGVTEAANAVEDMYEEARLIDFLRNHRSEKPVVLLDGLICDVRAFTGSESLTDDLTAMVLRRL
jgi:sigma-B regulation protein RsbU (phosphoserine phosphatase)